MEHQDNTRENATFTKRQPKPEEQALVDELSVLTTQYGAQFPHICRFVQKEADRINKGHKSLEEEHLLDVESGKPVRLTYKVSVPTEKYPNFNYVGRLLGPKGSTLRGLQEQIGCKLAILGSGSMRDKEKEERCRLEGGKYAHLNEDLHVWIQSFGMPEVAFYRLHLATKAIKKYLHADYNDEIFTEQMMMLEQEGGLPPKAFAAARGGPRGGRGGRGMRGRGGMTGMGGGMMGAGGNSMGRGGAPRGGGMMRGGGGGVNMRGRGGPRGSFMRGGRGGGMARGGGGGTGGGVNTEALYEDVYEPAPQAFNNTGGYENGSTAATTGNSYFEEFPEPGGGGGDAMNFPRQSQGFYDDGSAMANQDMSGGGMGMSATARAGGGGGMGGGLGMGQRMGMEVGGGMGMERGGGMNMEPAGGGMVYEQAGMGYDQGGDMGYGDASGGYAGMGSLKRGGMDDMTQQAKFARRY